MLGWVNEMVVICQGLKLWAENGVGAFGIHMVLNAIKRPVPAGMATNSLVGWETSSTC